MSGKKGFTVLEMIIASCILAMFFLAVYKIYRGVTSSVMRSQWQLKAQQHARNGLNFIREEMQRASYKTSVAINATTIVEAGYEFYLTPPGDVTGNKEVAKWTICVPVPGDSAILNSKLELSGGKLLYTRTADAKAPEEKPFDKKIVIEDISKVTIEKKPFDAANDVAGTLVIIKVEIKHPDSLRFPSTRSLAESGAKVEVEVKDLP